jgi:serine protease Do
MNVLVIKQSLLVVVLLLGLAQAGVAATRVALPDFTALVEANAAAVVNISTSKQQSVKRRLPPGMEIPEIPEDTPFGDLRRIPVLYFHKMVMSSPTTTWFRMRMRSSLN